MVETGAPKGPPSFGEALSSQWARKTCGPTIRILAFVGPMAQCMWVDLLASMGLGFKKYSKIEPLTLKNYSVILD